MVTYFTYTKPQRKVAITIFFNATFLGVLHLALLSYLPKLDQTEAVNQLLHVASIAIWPIEIILLSLVAYFWVKNKAFILSVSPTELFYYDPTFSDVQYRIPINDIVELEQFYDTQRTVTTNRIVLKSGEYRQLMYGNFNIDRHAFFKALTKANPNIILPTSPYRYETRKPKWAKKLLGLK